MADALANGLHDPGQLTAVPSVHVMWALLVAVIVIRVSTSRWRWLALLWPAATMMAVVVTGNHFWADGIVAGAILAIVLLIDRSVRLAPSLRRIPIDSANDRQHHLATGRAGMAGVEGVEHVLHDDRIDGHGPMF
jgi:MFS superfamily sulfate permease-like transporter